MPIATLTMNPSVDISVSVDRVVADRKLRSDQPRYEPGGGGINVSRALKKLGGDSRACFPCGGSTGAQLRDMLSSDGIRVSDISINGMTRQNLTAFEQNDGQQYRFVMPGPELAQREWQACLKLFDDMDDPPGYVVASGSLPPGVPDDFYMRLADIVSERGSKFIVDTSGSALKKVLGTEVFLIKPNVRELTDIAQANLSNEEDIEKAALEMLGQCRCQHIVVSLGAGGALLVSNGEVRHMRSPTVPIKSKVGAGDSMVAGLVLSLERGEDLTTAVRFAIAAGASAVMTPGTELCERESTERLFKQIVASDKG